MARSWEYAWWRRVVMQITLVIIFGGTLGLAAMVSRQRASALAVTLDNPIRVGAIYLQLPHGWAVHSEQRLPAVIVWAEEPPRPTGRRVVKMIQVRVTDPTISAQEFLGQNLNVPLLDLQQIELMGQPGAFAAVMPRSSPDEGDEGASAAPGLYGCTILPGGLAVMLQVSGLRTYGKADLDLFKQVAGSMIPAAGSGAPGPGSVRAEPIPLRPRLTDLTSVTAGSLNR